MEPTRAEDFHPAHFHHPTDITNTYLPMVPGTRLRREGHAFDDGEKVRAIESTVTGLTKEIAGVETVVGLDRDFTEGKAEEVEPPSYAFSSVKSRSSPTTVSTPAISFVKPVTVDSMARDTFSPSSKACPSQRSLVPGTIGRKVLVMSVGWWK